MERLYSHTNSLPEASTSQRPIALDIWLACKGSQTLPYATFNGDGLEPCSDQWRMLRSRSDLLGCHRSRLLLVDQQVIDMRLAALGLAAPRGGRFLSCMTKASQIFVGYRSMHESKHAHESSFLPVSTAVVGSSTGRTSAAGFSIAVCRLLRTR